MKKKTDKTSVDEQARARISELEEEVARLRAALPEPKLLADGRYRGTIVQADEITSATTRRFVRVKIAQIQGFQRNEVWTHYKVERELSPYEKLRLDLGEKVPNSPATAMTADPSDIVGKRVEFTVTSRLYGKHMRNEVTSMSRVRF